MFFPLPLTLFVILVLALSCIDSPTSTLRPTYTPYPTLEPTPTATLRPTYTPFPTLEPTLTPTITPRPIADPTMPSPTVTAQPTLIPSTPDFVELGPEEYFRGRALRAARKGTELFEAGEYQAAIDSYKEAQHNHGKPSAILENRLGLAYENLEMYSLAIEHYSNAIAIEDSALDRLNRAINYFKDDQCNMAIPDAQVALSLEPQFVSGLHTDVESNYLLAACYEYDDDLAALQHLDAAIDIAEEHEYETVIIAEWITWRDELREALNK